MCDYSLQHYPVVSVIQLQYIIYLITQDSIENEARVNELPGTKQREETTSLAYVLLHSTKIDLRTE